MTKPMTTSAIPACCLYCRTEFDAKALKGCPICNTACCSDERAKQIPEHNESLRKGGTAHV